MMPEYEWEANRFPRPAKVAGVGGFRFGWGPVAEYAALEFPRESLAWVVKLEPPRDPKGRNPGRLSPERAKLSPKR
jgi:hypothetical protein